MNTQTVTTGAATSDPVVWPGGRGIFAASGTWGSGTLTLTWSATSSGTYVPIGTGVAHTANGSTGFEMPTGYVKAVLTGSTDATVVWGVDGSLGRASNW